MEICDSRQHMFGLDLEQYVDSNCNKLKTGSKVCSLPRFPPSLSNKARLAINVFICYVSTFPAQNYIWSFLNDAESCRTRKNNDIVRQEV